jgi:hypothetical protein
MLDVSGHPQVAKQTKVNGKVRLSLVACGRTGLRYHGMLPLAMLIMR